MRAPLSEIAYRALTVVQRRAEQNGTDFFEELNQSGLAATEPRIQEIRISALKDLYDRLTLLNAEELLAIIHRHNSNPGTPSDIYAGILDWIRKYIVTQM